MPCHGAVGGRRGGINVASFDASATAGGVRFSVDAPGVVGVDTLMDRGGPVAHSLVDGLSNCRAFASRPYPGDLTVTGPGVLAGLTGLPSPPPYPVYVSSTCPTVEEASMMQPGYDLVAKSREMPSEPRATSGGSGGD